MGTPRQQRLDQFLLRLGRLAPFQGRDAAFEAVASVLREVEDELSGIPENPQAAFATVSDGRMYPPHDRFRVQANLKRIEVYRQKGHRTIFAENGALQINVEPSTTLAEFGD